MTKIDEQELKTIFDGLKKHDTVVFETFYAKYYQLIYGITFSILKNKTDSEDVTQIVFTKLYAMDKEKFPTHKEACWLYSLTKNETISFLRKKTNELDIESIYAVEDVNNEINEMISKDVYYRLISRLQPKEQEIVSLKILANLSFAEIGQMLNEPTGTVKWRYYKSVHSLKIILSNLGLFILTFVIGVKTLLNKDGVRNEEIIIQDENTTQNTILEDLNSTKTEREGIEEESKTDSIKQEIQEEKTQMVTENRNTQMNNNTQDIEENEGEQEVVTVEESTTSYTNYWGIGLMSISAIFLILTIIFSIFLKKNQPKAKKKMSKH